MIAAYSGQVNATRSLLQAKPDVEVEDNYKGTALSWALHQSKTEVAVILIDAGARYSGAKRVHFGME
jgi:ankyrin repeat protein